MSQTYAEQLEARRVARIARLKRRQPYRQKPDLPGMCKRTRRPWYGWALCRRDSARLQRAALIALGIIKCRIKRPKPVRLCRELPPRPRPPKPDTRRYDRRAEHSRYTFGRDGIGLLREFYDCYRGWVYR